MTRRQSFVPLALGLLVAFGVGARTAELGTQAPPPRIVAIADIHGAGDALTAILRAAELTDEAGRWTAGGTHFVQTGDYLDRGEKVREVLDTLMRLEGEARKAGGQADVLMGNHEVMNMLLDLRDVSPAAYAAFADTRSGDRRRKAYRDYTSVMKRGGFAADSEEQWNSRHPLGFVEYVEAISPRGRYGRWLRERKVVVAQDGTIFMHAGLSDTAPEDLEEVNRTAAREIANWDRTRELLVRDGLITPYFTLQETLNTAGAELKRIAAALDERRPVGDHVTRELVETLQSAVQIGKTSLLTEDGPLWFRGFATWPDSDGDKITALLERFGGRRFVTGHTPMVGNIMPRFDNRVFLIDTGMLSSRFKGGRPSALEITGDTVTAIYVGSRDVLVK